MKLQPELKTAKWIFDCSYLLASLPSQRSRRRALQKQPFTSDVLCCTSTGKMESSNRWCPLSWRFRKTSYLNGNCLSEGKKCIDFLTEDRNTLISSDYTEPHNGVRMLRPTIHTEFKHCKSSSNKSLNKQKR